MVDDVAGYSKDSFDWRTQLNSTNQLNTNLQPQEPQEPQTPVPSPPSRNQPPTFLESTSVADFFPRKSKASAKRALPSNGIDTQRFAARVEGFARCGTHLRPVFWGVFLHQNGSLRNVPSTDFFGGMRLALFPNCVLSR